MPSRVGNPFAETDVAVSIMSRSLDSGASQSSFGFLRDALRPIHEAEVVAPPSKWLGRAS